MEVAIIYETHMIIDTTMRCASAQLAHLPFEEGALLAAHKQAISQAKAQNVDLLVFPEASLTGYPKDKVQAQRSAMSVDDTILKELALLCGELVAVVGLVEQGGQGQLYNSIVWLHQGQVVATHRKINLPTFGRLIEGEIFAAGGQTTRMTLPSGWQCGGLICADFWDPGLTYLSAAAHDDILAVPFASTLEAVGEGFSNKDSWPQILKNHALVYSTPLIASNWVGRFTDDMTFWGGSTIVNEQGAMLAQAGDGADLIVADIDHEQIMAARSRLPTHRDLSRSLLRDELSAILQTTNTDPASTR